MSMGYFFNCPSSKNRLFYVFFLHFVISYHQMSTSPCFFFSRVLYHISAQYFNDQNRLISLQEMDRILCELRDQGGGDVIISEIGKTHVVK